MSEATKRSKRRITVAEINKANAVFWDYENLRDKEHLSDVDRGLKLGIEAIVNRTKRLAAFKGTTNSAKSRGANVAERNQRWRDAHARGSTPKQIQGDRKIRGKKQVSISTINRVLKGPRAI